MTNFINYNQFRDIKPSNYLFKKVGHNSKHLMIQDFGLACNACDDSKNPCDTDDVKNLQDECGMSIISFLLFSSNSLIYFSILCLSTRKILGTGFFKPPERLGEVSLYAFDMYSMGITFKELAIDKSHPNMASIINAMTSDNYKKRLSPDELLTKLFDLRFFSHLVLFLFFLFSFHTFFLNNS